MKKNKQSFKTPFMIFSLRVKFGFKGIDPVVQAVLKGKYFPEHPINPFAAALLKELAMPQAIKASTDTPMILSTEKNKNYWRKVKENVSCYPSELSYSTMKAEVSSEIIAELECTLTRIPLSMGCSPKRWKRCVYVMILKCLGATDLNSLRITVPFEVNCNYAFKHIGR
jgi:hypothetical protein